jgi:ferredoxin-NADP reductase
MSTRSSVPSHVAPIAWRLATVSDVVQETSSVRTLVLDVPGWPGHRAGQHVDVRVTAEDGYQAQRSYSIASAPEDTRLALTIERLDDGEVSPYLTEVLRVGDRLEFRGPIGGYFVWEATLGGPLLLVGGGSGMVPLMAMLRHRAVASRADARARHKMPARLLYSSRRWEDVIYRDSLARLAHDDETLEIAFTLTREQPDGWTGFRRRIDRIMLAEVAWTARRAAARVRVWPYTAGRIGGVRPRRAWIPCATCGAARSVGALLVYAHGMGMVMRCPSCNSVVMRIARTPARLLLDATGARLVTLAAAVPVVA